MIAFRNLYLRVAGTLFLCLLTCSAYADGREAIQKKILQLAEDEDPRVRFQAALSLGEVDLPGRVEALASIARKDAGDRWVRNAILSSIGKDTLPFLEVLIPNVDQASEGIDTLIQELSKLVGTKGDAEEIGRLLSVLSAESIAEPVKIVTLKGLSEGLQLSGSHVQGEELLTAPLAKLLVSSSDPIRDSAVEIASKVLPQDSSALDDIISKQIEVLKDLDADGEARVQAAKLLRLGSFDRVSGTLGRLLTSESHDALQVSALDTLATFNNPQVAEMIIEHWRELGPQAKVRALDILLARNDRAIQLLDAIESDKFPANILDAQKQSLLLSYPDPKVAEKAKVLFSELPSDENPELYEQYAEAITLKGDREHGKKIYEERCSQCHIAEGEGYQLGPDWTAITSNTRETLLTSILYPNRQVAPGFTNYILETYDEDIITGVLVFSGPNSVILRRAGGEEDTVLRKNISYLEDTKLSIMPTNLELGLSTQDMADLLTFIETLK